ncbi:HAMP domain-containing histidine kinase [Novosphingobium sp. KCTC 2891]|uniref:sensor histidine kinase n=1 Tax=Novosphingobium sp. KCTC 2891 TaxID=2989730 RepID=UPI002223905B|nr:HAMP domain-containing sensor histidine kinase [Novosphingobium sp. KCTC 2891]MCW1382533.1 HAMP domain-containing histidine kinase [Novosphingobium sp. KCTC 2891]
MNLGGSVKGRLALGLLLIGLFATITLCAAVFIEYRITLTDLAGPQELRAAWKEMIEHVGLPILVVLAPTLLATNWFIGRAFQPLSRAAAAIEATRAERGVRVETDDFPAEALPFVEAMNRLLARLDETAAQQEAFASDVAHELRTPLTIVAMELERPGPVDSARLRGEIMAMRRLIDQLLLLAQVNAEATAPLPATAFALDALAEDIVSLTAPQVIAGGRRIELQMLGHPGEVHGHREAVGAALRNLVENAARAAPAGTTVRITCGPGAVIRVGDDGPGLRPEQLARLVRRHERADHPSAEGAGLGLAIADRIMAAHGGCLATDFEAREIVMQFP